MTIKRTEVEPVDTSRLAQRCPYPNCEWVVEHSGWHQGPGIAPQTAPEGAEMVRVQQEGEG